MFVVRLPDKEFQGATKPVASAVDAKSFDSLADALAGADSKAIGISEYDDKTGRALRHLTVEDAETEATESEDNDTEEALTDGI